MTTSMNPIKSITKMFKSLSLCGKLLLFIIIVLIIQVTFFKKIGKEGFEKTEKFLLYDGNRVYDDFYSDIYDYLVYNTVLNDYEVGIVLNQTDPTEESVILDIGSGTGHVVSKLKREENIKTVGLDNSSAMIKKAKENYPDSDFVEGDAMNSSVFPSNAFTHILCLYFTIYYMEDKKRFFKNCMKWLKPGGYLVIHVVDREMFDPIIPPANPLIVLSPQRYAKERITKSKVVFDDFKYSSDFQLNQATDAATFVEKFHFKDGSVRKNEHKMYMPAEESILQIAQNVGFIVHAETDLIKVGYEYNKLVIFMKPG